MTSAEIYAFLTICEEMSISKAAEKLFISQSSLSSKIQTLEKELGYTLFLRGKGQRRIVLTDEGRQFFALASEYRHIVEEMLLIGKHKEKLRISTIDSIGTYLLPKAYERFMDKRPDVMLEIQDLDTKGSYENVSKGFTDIALATSVRNFPRVELQAVFSEEMTLVCSADNSLGDKVALEDLEIKNEIFIFWEESFVEWHEANIGQQEDTKIRIELMSHLEYFLRKKDSWAIVPVSIVKGLTDLGHIVEKQIDFEIPKRVTYGCAVSSNPKKLIMDDFFRCLKSVVEEMGEERIELLI